MEFKTLLKALFKPNEATREAYLKVGFMWVFLFLLIPAVLNGYATFTYTSKMLKAVKIHVEEKVRPKIPFSLPGRETAGLTALIPVLAGVSSALSLFIWFAVEVVILHLLAKALGGKGSIGRFSSAVACSFTPYLIRHVLRVLDSLRLTPEQAASLMRVTRWEKFLTGCLSLFSIWSLAILVFAVKNSHEIGARKSVALCLAFHVAFTAFVYLLIPSLPLATRVRL